MEIPAKKLHKLTDVAFRLLNCVQHNNPEQATLPSVDCSKAVTDKQADSLVRWHMRRWFKDVTRDEVLLALFEITHAMMELKQRNINQHYRITELEQKIQNARDTITEQSKEIRGVRDQATEFRPAQPRASPTAGWPSSQRHPQAAARGRQPPAEHLARPVPEGHGEQHALVDINGTSHHP
jgi:DNA primase